MMFARRKVLVLVAAFAMCVFTASSSSAQFGLKLKKALGIDRGGGNAGGGFKQNAGKFTKFLSIGTVNLLKAVSKMQEAIGEKELAEQILLQATSLANASKNGKATEEDYKKSFDIIDTSEVDRDKFAKIPAERGKKYVGQSSLHLALAAAADAKALSMATSLMSTPPSAIELLDGAIKTAFGLVKMATSTLPKHLEKAGEWGGLVGAYMTDNDIKPLSDAEKRKAAMEDGATEEETDELFGK